MLMNKTSSIFVTGHTGLLGSALVRQLELQGYSNILTATRQQLDLTRQTEVDIWFENNQPEYVFLVAAKLSGLAANRFGEDLYNNLQIETNVVDSARRNGCKKLLFTASASAYPKISQLPITEDQLLSGKLEPNHEGYNVAKIAGIKLCEMYRKQYGFNAISLMPCNLYGPGDNYTEHAHVVASMIMKFSRAKKEQQPSVTLWGDGSAIREFLYSDDMADASIFCMNHYDSSEPINVASGELVTVKQLAETIKQAVEYTGEIIWDTSMPTGTHARNVDVSKLKQLGWQHRYDLNQGILLAIDWYNHNE
jgi:GDP-L-fucose synthase